MSGGPRNWRPSGPDDRELDPAESPVRWERYVASIVRSATPELRRRAAGPGVAGQIGRWARPLVAAAAAVIVAASATLVRSADGGPRGTEAVSPGDPTAAATAVPPGDEEAPGLETAVYPVPVGSWMQGDEQPTVEEIVFSASVGRERP